jgi:hypothetical protein
VIFAHRLLLEAASPAFLCIPTAKVEIHLLSARQTARHRDQSTAETQKGTFLPRQGAEADQSSFVELESLGLLYPIGAHKVGD